MKTLKSILVHLTNYDSITFYNFVSALRTTEVAMKSGGWMVLDSAESLFCTAKSRVFGPESGGKDGAKKAKTDSKIDFDFEECPKWNALTEVVKEIKEEVKLNEKDHPPQQILIFVSDDRVRQQLEDLLAIGKSIF